MKWPRWQTLLFRRAGGGGHGSGLPAGCEQDAVEKVWMVFQKKLAATHEGAELKEGVWLEPIQAMLKHRNAMRTLVVEGGWVQKRLHKIRWSDQKK